MPNAIVTGTLGQDGSYLTEYLLNEGFEVHALYRRTSGGDHNRFTNLAAVLEHPRLHLVCGDITDHAFMTSLIASVAPDYFYNLAAMSHVGHSFKIPVDTMQVDATAVAAQLHAIHSHSPGTRYYQASTSELFGGEGCPEEGFNENSPFNPRSPYAIAKLAAYHLVRNYRERGIFAVNGILFNHSSPRRGFDFATRKITRGVARIKMGLQKKLRMGNMTAQRDVGFAQEYVVMMTRLMGLEEPEDFVLATGEAASIWDMLEHVCSVAKLDPNEVYEQDPRYMRPSDVPYLVGDTSKIQEVCDWEPRYNWADVLNVMYEQDLKAAIKEAKNG